MEAKGLSTQLQKVMQEAEEAEAAAGQEQASLLREELGGMKPLALKKRAKEVGVEGSKLDEADDADDVKATLIELIVGKVRGEAAESGSEAAEGGGDKSEDGDADGGDSGGEGGSEENMEVEQQPAAAAPETVDLSWLELLPPKHLKPLCKEKKLPTHGNSEALAERLRANGGLSVAQLKGLCETAGVTKQGIKAQVAQRIGDQLRSKAAAKKEKSAAKAAKASEDGGEESEGGGEAAEGGGGLGASASEKAPPVEKQEEEAPPRQQTLLAAANHLLGHYFNVPYPLPGAAPLHVPQYAALPADDPPPSEHRSAHGVPRPNHGLANAVRKAALVRPIAKAYASGYVGTSLERSDFALGDDQLLALEVAALFSAAGRESELSYSEDAVRHSAYKKVSCDAFAAYAESIQLPHRGPALQALRGMFASRSAMTRVLEVAHDLDLFRCCTAGQMRPKLESIQGELQTSSVNALPADRLLFQRAVDAIRATGDRLLSLPPASREEMQDRQPGTFCSCSLGEEAPEACMRAALLLPPPAPTLAKSAFLRTYNEPNTKPRMHFQLEMAVYGLITWHARRAGLKASEADTFFNQIRTNALSAALDEDNASELLQPRLLMLIAVRLWTSTGTLGSREFCSLLNEALRNDDADAIVHAVAITHALNAFCVTGRSIGSPVRWPPKHVTYRGTAMPRTFKEFFTVGKKYRAPMFVATSFREDVAVEHFLMRLPPPTEDQTPPIQEPTLWRFHLNSNLPERERCKQANFIDRTDGTVGDEHEFLFSPYSVFTVRAVSWHAEPLVNEYVTRSHVIDVDVASDNKREPNDLPLAPWC